MSRSVSPPPPGAYEPDCPTCGQIFPEHCWLDRGFRVQIHPESETSSPLLRQSLLEREGDQLELPDRAQVLPEFIDQQNQHLEWWST